MAAPLIVFDEPTSALDGVSEDAIVATLRELRGETTCVVVAHRPATLAACSRVVVVEHGSVGAREPATPAPGGAWRRP